MIKKNVNKNIVIACKKISKSYKKLILLNQIHSNKFFLIKNFKFLKKKKLIGDALITDQKKIIIGILTADCAPVLIFDKKLKIISAIHAGWKGAYKGIIQKVIKNSKKKVANQKILLLQLVHVYLKKITKYKMILNQNF